MSGNELMNESKEGVVEFSEMPVSNVSALGVVAISAVSIAVSVALVMYFKKRRANAKNAMTEEVQNDETTNESQE